MFTLTKQHFDRLFRKRNPSTLKPMARMTELLLTRRVMAPNISDSVPLVKCFVYKLKEQLGDLKNDGADGSKQFNLPEMSLDPTIPKSREASPKAYFWSSENSMVPMEKSSPKSMSGRRSNVPSLQVTPSNE